MTKELRQELEQMEQHLQGDEKGLEIFKQLKTSVEAQDAAARGHIADQHRTITQLANRIEWYAERLDMVERPEQFLREKVLVSNYA